MRFIVFILLFSFQVSSSLAQGIDMEYVRDRFHASLTERSVTEELHKYFEKNQKGSSKAIALGYEGVVETMMAERVSSPFSKYSYFNSGRKKLEKAIKKSPQDIELRYLRLLVQTNCPWFLEYHDNIEEDSNFIRGKIKTGDTSFSTQQQNILKHILQYMLTAGLCTPDEEDNLQQKLKG